MRLGKTYRDDTSVVAHLQYVAQEAKSLADFDAKTAALLTHVSVLAGITAVLLPTGAEGDKQIFGITLKYLLTIEFILYLIITLGCLYCIRVTAAREASVSFADRIGKGVHEIKGEHQTPLQEILNENVNLKTITALDQKIADYVNGETYKYITSVSDKVRWSSVIYKTCLYFTALCTLLLIPLSAYKLLQH